MESDTGRFAGAAASAFAVVIFAALADADIETKNAFPAAVVPALGFLVPFVYLKMVERKNTAGVWSMIGGERTEAAGLHLT